MLTIFVFGFCTFTVLLFGCFSRKFVQVWFRALLLSRALVPHVHLHMNQPRSLSIAYGLDVLDSTVFGVLCVSMTSCLQMTSKIAFWTFFLKYLHSTISTREFITRPSSKYRFITTFDELYNGVRQLYNLWKLHTGIELWTLHLTFTKKKALCSNVYIEISGHL